MKVLHIISDLNTAGAQTVVMNYFRYLHDDKDLDMAILVNGSPADTLYEQEAAKNGYRIIFSNYQPITSFPLLGGIINWFRFQKSMYRVLKLEAPDIIHTHGTALLAYITIPSILARIKVRIHTLHSDPYAIRKVFVIWAKMAFRIWGFYPICVTESQAEKAEKRYGIKNYTIIKNGIDGRRFTNKKAGKEIRDKFGISENTIVIGCVGRFDKIKNHSFLIGIFSLYLKENQNAVLMLVGDGAEKENIKKKAQECGVLNKIIFTGVCSDVENYYYAMDLFMLTSFFESSSIVTVEAQFAGKRCVITNNIPENVVVTDNVNRISLTAPTETWLSAMKDELPHDKVVGTLEDFSMDRAASMLKKLYLKLNK